MNQKRDAWFIAALAKPPSNAPPFSKAPGSVTKRFTSESKRYLSPTKSNPVSGPWINPPNQRPGSWTNRI